MKKGQLPMQQVRMLEKHEGQLLKELLLRMYADTPTAYGETLAKAKQYADEEWQQLAEEFASSPSMVAFMAESSGEA